MFSREKISTRSLLKLLSMLGPKPPHAVVLGFAIRTAGSQQDGHMALDILEPVVDLTKGEKTLEVWVSFGEKWLLKGLLDVTLKLSSNKFQKNKAKKKSRKFQKCPKSSKNAKKCSKKQKKWMNE